MIYHVYKINWNHFTEDLSEIICIPKQIIIGNK